ncbi:NlpC/P60 family protein [soil metagenome]
MEEKVMHDQAARKVFLAEQGYEPRTTLWRADVAAQEYRGILEASHYAQGKAYQCTVPSTPLRFELSFAAAVENQLLRGDLLDVYKINRSGGLAWGKARHDGHVGFVRLADLSSAVREITHFVSVPFTPVYPFPDTESNPIMNLGLNSRVSVDLLYENQTVFARIGEGQWVSVKDLKRLGDWFKDPIAAILPLAGCIPYVWGHRDGFGYDCSSLIQAGEFSMGNDCYRDTDQQEEDPRLGGKVAFKPDLSDLQPYDLVHYPHHVVRMVDKTNAIHARGGDVRRVVIEPIADINRWRLRKYGLGVSSVKRR